MRTHSPSITYPDRWLRIIGIPLIALLIQHIGLDWEMIKEYATQNYYYHNLIFNTSLTFLLWALSRRLVLYLDQKMPYADNFSKRIMVQMIGSILITVLVGELFTFLYVKVLFEADYWENHWNTDLPVSILLIILLNLVYIGFYLFQRPTLGITASQNASPPPTTPDKSKPQPLAMISRNKTVLIPLTEIILIASKDRLSFGYLKDGQKLLIEKTIKQLAAELPEADFFLANRAQIIQRQYIASHQKTSTRKLLISLHELEQYEEEISVSKARTPLFLSWLSV